MQDKIDTEKQIEMMAQDLEIQKEIKNIENEFMLTESDGLENLYNGDGKGYRQ